jgi:hypothetical protein
MLPIRISIFSNRFMPVIPSNRGLFTTELGMTQGTI